MPLSVCFQVIPCVETGVEMVSNVWKSTCGSPSAIFLAAFLLAFRKYDRRALYERRNMRGWSSPLRPHFQQAQVVDQYAFVGIDDRPIVAPKLNRKLQGLVVGVTFAAPRAELGL